MIVAPRKHIESSIFGVAFTGRPAPLKADILPRSGDGGTSRRPDARGILGGQVEQLVREVIAAENAHRLVDAQEEIPVGEIYPP